MLATPATPEAEGRGTMTSGPVQTKRQQNAVLRDKIKTKELGA
jgi:hypothetical protein